MRLTGIWQRIEVADEYHWREIVRDVRRTSEMLRHRRSDALQFLGKQHRLDQLDIRVVRIPEQVRRGD